MRLSVNSIASATPASRLPICQAAMSGVVEPCQDDVGANEDDKGGGERDDQPERQPVEHVDVDGQVIETFGPTQAGQLGDRPPQHRGKQCDAQPGQTAQGRIVRGQPFAVARGRAAEGQRPHPGARPEDIEDESRAGHARPTPAAVMNQPESAEQGDAGGKRDDREENAEAERPSPARARPGRRCARALSWHRRQLDLAIHALGKAGIVRGDDRLAPPSAAAISASVTLSAVTLSRSAVGSSARMTSTSA